MPTQTTAVARPDAKRDIRALLRSEGVREQVAAALPSHMTADRILRVMLTTINRTPALQDCSTESLMSCLLQCSQIGLEPDGRNAHLIPYGTKATLIVDWKGLVALARRNGVSVTPKLVCQNDVFKVQEDDGTGKSSVLHVVDYTKPRGEVYAVYSRAVVDGIVDYEIMTKDEVEYIRNTYSKGRDADAWKKSWGQMACKTVIRRHSKRWDLDPEVASAFEADDPPQVSAPPAPVRPIFSEPVAIPEAMPSMQAPEPVAESDDDDGDLGPSKPKRRAAVAAPAPQPEAQPQAEATEPPADGERAGFTKPAINYPRAVRGLLRLGGHEEAELLDWLRATNKIDESLSSLEEILMVNPDVLTWVHDSWKAVNAELKRLKKVQSHEPAPARD